MILYTLTSRSILEVNHVSSGYGSRQILFDVSFKIATKEIVSVQGLNGSGKSTMLKVLFGLHPVWTTVVNGYLGVPRPLFAPLPRKIHGTIFFHREDVTALPPNARLRKGLLYVAQKNGLFEELTVAENFEMAGLGLESRSKFHDRMKFVMDLFPMIAQLQKRTPMHISGGEQKLLALAMAMLHRPRLLLVDEPFAGLSASAVDLVLAHLTMLRESEGAAMLIVEHRPEILTNLADRNFELTDGVLLEKQEVNSVRKPQLL